MREIDILKWVHEVFHGQSWLNYIMTGITYLGEFGLSVIVCAIVLFCIKKTRRAGFEMGVAIAFELLIVHIILKLTVNRARPWTEYDGFVAFYEQFGIRRPTDSSFPSGHSAILFCGAIPLLFTYKAKGVPAIVIAFLVALSRIYLCLHYPTDVLGGALIGTACGFAGHYAAKGIIALLKKKFPQKFAAQAPPDAAQAPDAEESHDAEQKQDHE